MQQNKHEFWNQTNLAVIWTSCGQITYQLSILLGSNNTHLIQLCEDQNESKHVRYLEECLSPKNYSMTISSCSKLTHPQSPT